MYKREWVPRSKVVQRRGVVTHGRQGRLHQVLGEGLKHFVIEVDVLTGGRVKHHDGVRLLAAGNTGHQCLAHGKTLHEGLEGRLLRGILQAIQAALQGLVERDNLKLVQNKNLWSSLSVSGQQRGSVTQRPYLWWEGEELWL